MIVAYKFAYSKHLLHASVIVTTSAMYQCRETYRFGYPKLLAGRLGGNSSAMRIIIVVVSWLFIVVPRRLCLQYLCTQIRGKLYKLSLATLELLFEGELATVRYG